MRECTMRIMLNYDEYCKLLDLRCENSKETNRELCFYEACSNLEDARSLGEMNVRKTELSCSGDILASLSENTYLETADYELEIEYDPEVMRSAECLLNYYAEYIDDSLHGGFAMEFAERTRTAETKAARFLRKLHSIIAAQDAEREEYVIN